MKGDFTRFTHDAKKHYTGVLKQQGRVDLDADWNEQIDIDAHLREITNIDVIGRCGIPIHEGGFRIGLTTDNKDLTISPGRIYVDGILCELEEPRKPDWPITYLYQPDFPNPGKLTSNPGNTDLVYLDVWKRHITALEDPDIREKALGGPDTTTRIKTVWQVKILQNVEQCDDLQQHLQVPPLDQRGRLSTGTDPAGTDEPCIIAPGGGYRGLENRLYRVEIHDGGGPGEATFKWSRDNGSIVFGIESFVDAQTVKVKQIGKDEVLALRVGDWVEVLGDTDELHNRPGIMAQIVAEGTDLANRIVKLSEDVSGIKDQKNPKLRRWDQPSNAISIDTTDTTRKYELEDGIWIQFSISNGHQFYSGDYWVFAARAATGQVDELVNAPPRGIEHHYCALATVEWTSNSDDTSVGDSTTLGDRYVPPISGHITHCAPTFPPLTELPTGGASCCTVTVGDGIISHGDYRSIQEAVKALAELLDTRTPAAGQICILPGIYDDLQSTVVLEGLAGKSVVIKGCGQQTRIEAPQGQPAFFARNCRIRFESLTVAANSPFGAIDLWQCVASGVRDCVVCNGKTTAGEDPSSAIMPEASPFTGAGPAVVALGSGQVTIEDSTLYGTPAIILQAIDGTVQRNFCRGGAWIWDGSSLVEVVENRFIGASGPGVLLGGILPRIRSLINHDLLNEESGVRGVTIHNNRILWMTHSGIASATEVVGESGLGDLEDITITDNTIFGCARRPIELPAFPLDGDGVGGMVLNNVSRLQIRGNTIMENGPENYPACGILVEDGEGVEILDNHIAENGAARISPTCIDFSKQDTGKGTSGPLSISGVTFKYTEVADGLFYQIDEAKIGSQTAKGLCCNKPITVTLPAVARSVTLYFVGPTDSSATVKALDGGGKQVDEASSQLLSKLGLFQLEVSGAGIKRLQITKRQRNGKTFWLVGICGSAFVGYQAGIAALWTYGGEYQPAGDDNEPPSHLPGRAALRVSGNTVVCPAGQALWANGVGPIQVSDNVFTSRGQYNQPIGRLIGKDEPIYAKWLDLTQIGRCVSIVDLGVAVELSRTALTGFLRAAPQPSLSEDDDIDDLDSVELPFGLVQYHGNQSTFHLRRQTSRTGFANFADPSEKLMIPPTTFIVSLDDVAMQDNQIRANVEGAILTANALTVGPSVRVNNNRFSESLGKAWASSAGVGFFNNTTGNIGTHCIVVQGHKKLDAANQELICRESKKGQAQAQLKALIDNTEALIVAGASLLVERQKLHAVRWQAVAARLKEKLPEDDLRRLTAEALAARADAQAAATTRWVERSAKAPKVDPDDWAVFGNVRLSNGELASDYKVQVCYYGKPGEKKVEVASTQTNEYGDFFIVLDMCHLRESFPGSEIPKVHLCVQGDAGVLEMQPDDGMEIKQGQTVTIPVRLKKLDQ